MTSLKILRKEFVLIGAAYKTLAAKGYGVPGRLVWCASDTGLTAIINRIQGKHSGDFIDSCQFLSLERASILPVFSE
ncbi:hypothetical protein GZ77_20325 [Endozoicomonas montiporae]|uniref:Uncharacterized protein n=2 Tax=Endozoicomonas montiporae TaxID=1027273 RepID=A0A081N2Y1_9GAMM|nr:hypothetical protein EZMO1_4147 [Endozoicomonas montiporae CL-33]KEQ12804.1 hypothetical protein GZ77_20325 [Endozoicomonas montiporae]